MGKKVATPAARCAAARYAIEQHGYSERRACQPMAVNRRTLRQPSSEDKNAALRQRLRELAAARPRFGGPRLQVMLRQEGWAVTTSGWSGSIARKAVAKAAPAQEAREPVVRGAPRARPSRRAVEHGLCGRRADERTAHPHSDVARCLEPREPLPGDGSFAHRAARGAGAGAAAVKREGGRRRFRSTSATPASRSITPASSALTSGCARSV